MNELQVNRLDPFSHVALSALIIIAVLAVVLCRWSATPQTAAFVLMWGLAVLPVAFMIRSRSTFMVALALIVIGFFNMLGM